MSIEIRRTQPGQARAVTNVIADALLFPRMTDDELATREASYYEFPSLGAWEGDRCVGHAGAFPLDTTVPGGARVPTAGVTRVGVLPTHTRRGLLTSMMHQLLTEAREGGTVLASLRASEAVIYQRFGFEVAGEGAAAKVIGRAIRPVLSPASGTVRILAVDEISDLVPRLYDSCARRRVGTVSRPDLFWTRLLDDAITVKKPSFIAVHEDPRGTPDGYARYDVCWAPRPDGSEVGAGTIHELFGADAAIERALWAYLLDIDLIEEWTADNRPIDEAIRFAGRDTRGYKLTARWDEQWLRILDVDAALGARTYQPCGGEPITVSVTDPLFPANDGTRRIGPAGAVRTADEPDLVASIGALSAVYLGGTSWRELADAGRVEVRCPGAVERADTLFAQRPAPFCGTFF